MLQLRCDVCSCRILRLSLSSSPNPLPMAFTTSSAASLHPPHPPNSSLSSRSLLHVVSLPHAIWLVIAATLAGTLEGANAYSWNFRSNPQQCQNATIVLSGNGGTPPFSVLMIPFGASPLPNNIEARRITEQVFVRGNQRSGDVQVNYPANSQFVAVVSFSSVLIFFIVVWFIMRFYS